MNNVRPSAGISDHCIILADLSTKVKLPSKPPRNVPLWRKADNVELKQMAAVMKYNFFAEKPEEKCVEDNWSWFRDTINKIVTDCVPHKLLKGRPITPWFTLVMMIIILQLYCRVMTRRVQ